MAGLSSAFIRLNMGLLPRDTLPPLYGLGAFPIDYPNAWDRYLGRTGTGIWIHGTQPDSFSRPPLSSRGCVTLNNEDLGVIEPLVDIGVTPVVAADRVQWVDPTSVRSQREELLAQLEVWREDWESKDSDRDLGHCSTDFRSGGMTWRSSRSTSAASMRAKSSRNGTKATTTAPVRSSISTGDARLAAGRSCSRRTASLHYSPVSVARGRRCP